MGGLPGQGLIASEVDYGCGARTGGGDGDGEGEEIRGADAPYRVAEAPFSQEVE